MITRYYSIRLIFVNKTIVAYSKILNNLYLLPIRRQAGRLAGVCYKYYIVNIIDIILWKSKLILSMWCNVISHVYIIHIWRDQTSYHNNTIIRGNITHLTMLCHGNLRHLVNKTVFRTLTFNWFVYRFPCLYRCTNRGDTTNPLYNTSTIRVHLGTLVPTAG